MSRGDNTKLPRQIHWISKNPHGKNDNAPTEDYLKTILWLDGTVLKGVITKHHDGKYSFDGTFVTSSSPKGTDGSKLTKEEQKELLKLFEAEKVKVDAHSMVSPRPMEGLYARVVPIERDPTFSAVTARPGDGNGSEAGNYIPFVAGPGAQITGTIIDPNEQPGVKAFYVGVVDAEGHHTFFQGATDVVGHLKFALPAIAGLSAIQVFRHFDKSGNPDQGATCQVTDQPAHVPNTQLVGHPPQSGLAIVEGSSAYQLGPDQGMIELQTRGINPTNAKILLDGNDQGIDTLAASDRSIVGKLHDDVALGKHMISVRSDSTPTNGFSTYVVTQTFDPLPRLKIGQVATVTLHVRGVAAQEQATVTFHVSGSATLETGGETALVALHDGTASVRIRGVRPGELVIHTILEVNVPDFRALLEHFPTG